MISIKLDKSKKYLLGCSYGPDSMTLFDLLCKGGYDFSVAHVNYGLRKEAKKETENLISYCDKKGIKIHTYFVNKKIENNIEEKCREIRYSFFSNLIKEEGYDAILIAHNQDDAIETYLLQKKRKNIVYSYGLQEKSVRNNVPLFRPLLNITKEELKKYNDANNVPYAIDKSNLEDRFERNKIRHSVVEKMTKKDRSTILSEIRKTNKNLLSRRSEIIKFNPRKVEQLLDLSDTELAFYLTERARIFVPSIELSLNRIKEFRKILLSNKSNVIIHIKNDVYFVKSYNIATIKLLPKDINFYFEINEPSEFDCDFFYLNFTKNSANRNVKKSDYPLIVRNASKNDVMVIKNYTVTMRRQFINWKMPLELRDRWPVICNKQGKLIYVPRYNADFVPDSDTNFYVKI